MLELLLSKNGYGKGLGRIIKTFVNISGWVLLGVIVVLCVSYFTRIIAKKLKLSNQNIIVKVTILLKTIHKPLGIFGLVLGLLHGILSLNCCNFYILVSGGVAILVCFLDYLVYLLQKKFKKWLSLHRILGFLSVVFSVAHILICVFIK